MNAEEHYERAAMFRRFAELIDVPEVQSPAVWAAENRVYGPTTGVPGPRNPWLSPSLVPFTEAATSGLYTRAVAVCAAQMGKTDGELDIIGQRLDQRPTPILYVGPSAEFNRDQFEPRLKQMIDESATLKGKLVRGQRDKKTLKIVAGVKVRLASGGSSTSLKSDSVGLAIVDEYDEMTANIRGQGDPLGLVEARGETYADFLTVITSTPGRGVVETEEIIVGFDENGDEITMEFFAVGDATEIESPIWRLFQEGTRHHWAWHCPHCDVPFIPMRKHLRWAEGSTPSQARKSAYLTCPSNGCVIEDDDDMSVSKAMNATGFMIAPGQTIEDAKAERNVPESSTYSQWSSGLASPFVSWGLRAERLVKAEMSNEEDKRQTAMNANFGEVYSPGISGDMPDWQDFLKKNRTGLAPGETHPGMLRFVMGVDVQKRGIYYVTRGFGSRGTSWLVDHGYLMGDTAEDDIWQQLANLIMTPISGVRIEKAFIDSGFRPDKKEAGSIHRVYQFCRTYSFVASPCKTRSTSSGKPISASKIDVKDDNKVRAFSISLILLDPDYFKSLVHLRIKTQPGADGSFYLHGEADEEYARQVLSEVRTVKPGRAKAEWKRLRTDNHYFDAEALAAAAGYVLNVQAIPSGVRRSFGDDLEQRAPRPAKPETVDAEPELQQSEPEPKVDPLVNLRNRFRNAGGAARRR